MLALNPDAQSFRSHTFTLCLGTNRGVIPGQLVRVVEARPRKAIVQDQVGPSAKVRVDVQIQAPRVLLADLDERRHRFADGEVVSDDVIDGKAGVDAAVPSLPAVTDLVVARGAGSSCDPSSGMSVTGVNELAVLK